MKFGHIMDQIAGKINILGLCVLSKRYFSYDDLNIVYCKFLISCGMLFQIFVPKYLIERCVLDELKRGRNKLLSLVCAIG